MENKFYNNDKELLLKLKLVLENSIINAQDNIALIQEELDRQERESTGDNK